MEEKTKIIEERRSTGDSGNRGEGEEVEERGDVKEKGRRIKRPKT